MIRKAAWADLSAVMDIYRHILDREEAGLGCTGWLRGVYPTEQTARAALEAGELYVGECDDRVAAAARINHAQVPQYALCPWAFAAPPEQVLVLHTLVVEPSLSRRGLGAAFVAFFEDLARGLGCACVRLDTGVDNLPARAFYVRLGYREAGVIPCGVAGLEHLRMVCLEKRLQA